MHNLKWTIKFLVLLFAFSIVNSQLSISSVSAHALKTDGNIGAILHIDPDDDPIAGSQSGFLFEFKDKQNKFTPQNCDCTFSIIEDGKEIYVQPLFQNNQNPSLDSASVFFTFPERNVYQIKVAGKPTPSDAFQPFSLVWDVRVARAAPNIATNSSPVNQSWFLVHLPHLTGGLIVVIFLILALIKQLCKSKNS